METNCTDTEIQMLLNGSLILNTLTMTKINDVLLIQAKVYILYNYIVFEID